MTALHPDELAKLTADIIGLLERGVRVGGGGSGIKQRRESVGQGYRWLYGEAYGLTSNEPHAATSCKNCAGEGWTYDEDRTPLWRRCEQCAPSEHADQTGDAVANRHRQMLVVRKVSGHMAAAKESVAKAVALVQGETEQKADPIPTPRTEPRAGVDEALAAAGRRAERGEGWGEA